ncbi:MAG TPA: NTP transferase domain-containing protein [Anaerolineales bacterium]|nr:NTP transferase domain-containing protein [Anaerolineales bacterium]
MQALLMCGSVPDERDPLYPYTRGGPKALLDVAGRPMAQWVLDALNASAAVDGVVIIGLDATSGLIPRKPVAYLPDHGGAVPNALAGVERALAIQPDATHVLLTSCDVPAVTAEMIDWRVRVGLEAAADFDYLAIERTVMEQRYPASRRTYTPLRGTQVCGGDINMAHVRLAKNAGFIGRLTAARKSPLRMASMIGWNVLFLFLTRQLTIERGEQLVSRNLGIHTRIHLCPYAELGMDVDKPHQLEILRADLAGRALAVGAKHALPLP